MARSGINKALVQRARDALIARDLQPSIEAVRAELGHTGSKTTIQRYLKELAELEPTPRHATLSDELQTVIASLAQRLAAEAQQAVSADRARLQRQQDTYRQQQQIDAARQEELQKSHLRLEEDLRECREINRSLAERLQERDGERQRLLTTEQHLQHLLVERASQIHSLEEKHTHAREALKHYREQTQQQRNGEITRFESQSQQQRVEVRRVQEQLMSKQEELAQAYRELEKLTAVQAALTQELRKMTKNEEIQAQRIQQLESKLMSIQDENISLNFQLSIANEKARRYLLDRRQDNRNLRSMAKQLTQMERLLEGQHVKKQ